MSPLSLYRTMFRKASVSVTFLCSICSSCSLQSLGGGACVFVVSLTCLSVTLVLWLRLIACASVQGMPSCPMSLCTLFIVLIALLVVLVVLAWFGAVSIQ